MPRNVERGWAARAVGSGDDGGPSGHGRDTEAIPVLLGAVGLERLGNKVMKLLLCENVSKLGIVGDIVEVSAGYARNYLIPYGVATEPTRANMRKLAEARKHAEHERVQERKQIEALAKRMDGVEVTVRARANEEGVLYGSVGPKEIAVALCEEGYPIEAAQVALEAPIRQLDNVAVPVELDAELSCTVKVWVVREKTQEDADSEEIGDGSDAGREAGWDDDGSVE